MPVGDGVVLFGFICFVLLLGWENRLMSVGRLMGVVVFTVFDTSDILDTSDVVAV